MVLALTWETLDHLSVLVAAVAALIALGFAWATVEETRKLRRDDRLSRLAALVAKYSMETQQHLPIGASPYPVTRAQFAGAIATFGDDPLPACRALLALDPSSRGDVVTSAATDASKELAHLAARRLRPEAAITLAPRHGARPGRLDRGA